MISTPDTSEPQRRLRVAIFNDTRRSRHYGCHLVMNRLIHGLRDHAMDPIWLNPVGVDWRLEAHLIPGAPDIDLVIVNGEGSIHHPSTRPRAEFLSKVAGFAHRELGVPAVLLNATVSDLNDRAARDLTRFDALYVRESATADYLGSLRIQASVVADLTFRDVPWRGTPPSGIAVTDSVLPDVTDRLRALASREGWAFQPMIAPRDLVSSRWRMAPGAIKAFEKWIACHALVITGRFHTVSMCLASRTPFVAIDSNSPKISAFVGDVFGDTRRVMKAEEIMRADLRRFASFSQSELEAVERALADTKRRTEAMFEDCRRLAAPGGKR